MTKKILRIDTHIEYDDTRFVRFMTKKRFLTKFDQKGGLWENWDILRFY